jgi:iron complex transport system substrate-binding protein
MRVVSLNCSNTEIVAALGCGELPSASTTTPTSGELVARLPRVGRDLDIDVGRTRRCGPTSSSRRRTPLPGHEKVIAALEARSSPISRPMTTSFADVSRDVREIARRLGVAPRGEQLAAAMVVPSRGSSTNDSAPSAAARRGAEEVAERPRDGTSDRPRILVEWWPRPVIVPGRRSG